MNDGWIDASVCRPGYNCTVEVWCDGGQFVGKWMQEAEYIDGHFYYQDIVLDKEVYIWRYPKKKFTNL